MTTAEVFKGSSRTEDETVVLMGDRYRVLLDAGETGRTLGLIQCVIQPGGGPPPHLNRYEDLTWYVIENELLFTLGERSQRVSEGESLFIPKETDKYHTFHNDGQLPAKALLIVSPGGFEGFLRAAGLPAGSPLVEPTPEAILEMVELGKQYGMDMKVG